MARVIWSRSATTDLHDVLEHIARDAPLAAKRFAQRIFARVQLLRNHPLSGAYLLEDSNRIYREVLQGNYRIIYRYDGETVTIIAVLHAARLLNTDELG